MTVAAAACHFTLVACSSAPDRPGPRPSGSSAARWVRICFMSVADLLSDVLGDDVPVAFRAYDGSTLRAGRCPHDHRRALPGRPPPHRHRPRRARVRPRLRRRRARGRRRHLRRDGRRQLHRGAAARPATDRGRGQARRVEGPQAAAAAARGGAAARPAPLAPARRRRDRAPLRRVERLLRMVLGPSLTYSCAVWHDDTTTLEDAQANKHELICRKLDARARACASSTSAAGGAACCCTRPSTTACRRWASRCRRPQAELARKRAAERGLGDRVEVRSRRLPRRRRRSVRRHQLDRHVRARRACRSSTRYFARCRALLRPAGPAPQPRHQPSAPRGQDAPPPLGAGVAGPRTSPSATCSPTASCTRSATSCPPSSAPGSRPATWRACASTTRSRCGAGCATSRTTGTTRWRGRARPRACVAPLHGGRRGGLRARRQPGAPGARHGDDRRRQRHAPAGPDSPDRPDPGALMSAS